MKTAFVAAAVLAALFAFAGPAAAREERNQIGHQIAFEPDPAMSYIFFRSAERLDVQFIREPTEEERRKHGEARDEAYARARARYDRQFARWQREEEECRGNQASYCLYRPSRPALVSPETFAFPPIELSGLVSIERGRPFTRGEGEYNYLMRVQPGSYVLYGTIMVADAAPVGICLCMGSVRFDAPAGSIVDLGEIRYAPERARELPRRNMESQWVVPPAPGAALPERLAGRAVVPAVLRAAGKLPNFFAVEIDRHAPIEGVLAYDRDRVVDLRAEAPAPAGD